MKLSPYTLTRLAALACASVLFSSQGFAQQITPDRSNAGTQGAAKSQTGVENAKNQLSAAQPVQPNVRALIIDAIPARSTELNKPITINVGVRDPQGNSANGYSYYLYNAPPGAYIDPLTGRISWTPTAAGQYSFFVGVAENNVAPPRYAWSPLNLNVTEPLHVFGYDFFARARAIIDARLFLMRNGMLPPTATQSSANQGASSMLSIPVTQGQVPQIAFPTPTGTPLGMGTQNGTNSLGATLQNPGFNLNNGSQQPVGNNNGGLTGPIGPVIPGPTGGTVAPGTNNFVQNFQNNGNNGNTTASGNSGNQPQNQQPGSGTNVQPVNPLANNPANSTLGLQPIPSTPPGTAVIVPNPNIPFQTQQPGTQQNASATASALLNFVGPLDQMLGMNVYVPAPERYQLGPGDTITVRVWSPTMEARDFPVRIDASGTITLPQGNVRLVLRGMTLGQAEARIRTEIRRQIRDGDVSVTLSELRTMSVTVMGEAYLPGNYQVPAVSTLFNALYVFGGPNDNGSLRQIELRRTNGTRVILDLYNFLLRGDARGDVPLQPGDVIFIPPAVERVTVDGEVPRPAIYEVLPNEHLHDVVAFAGGAKPTGVTQRISLETVQPGVGRVLKDIDLKDLAQSNTTPVYNGDIVTISSIREEFLNRIALEGNVDQPGNYAFIPGMTVADLITKARGVLRDTYMSRADLFRENPDKSTTLIRIDLNRAMARQGAENPALQPNDRVVVYGINDVQWMGERQVDVVGAVRKPGTFYRSEGMTVADLVLQAGGLLPEAFDQRGFLQRRNPDGTVGPLLNIDFRRMLAGDAANNPVLGDHDVLTVQTVQEANYIPEQTVQIIGAVQRPGRVARGTNMTLKQLIDFVGGPLPNASDVVEIANARVATNAPRTTVRLADVLTGASDVPLRDGDVVTLATNADIVLNPKRVILVGAVKKPGPYTVNATTDTVSGLITRAGGFMPNSFPEGAQFYRNPELLKSDFQKILAPKIEDALQIVARDEYARASAKASAEIFRLVNSGNGSASTLLPLLPGTTGTATTQRPNVVPPGLFSQPPVTPARPLDANDLIPGGNINVNVEKAMKRRGSPDDLVLQDGDILVIPDRPSTVGVVGAVVAPSAVLFQAGKTVGYYIDNSGGLTLDAAKDRILVIRANGLLVKANRGTRINLGDLVWVPTKVMAEKLTDKAAEIDAATKNISAGAIVLAVIRSILK